MEECVNTMIEVSAENHVKVSMRGHKKARKDARENDIKSKCQIEFDRKLVEIEAHISALTETVHEGQDTYYECFEWNL